MVCYAMSELSGAEPVLGPMIGVVMDARIRKDSSQISKLTVSEKKPNGAWCKPELVKLNIRETKDGTLPFVEAGDFGTPST